LAFAIYGDHPNQRSVWPWRNTSGLEEGPFIEANGATAEVFTINQKDIITAEMFC